MRVIRHFSQNFSRAEGVFYVIPDQNLVHEIKLSGCIMDIFGWVRDRETPVIKFVFDFFREIPTHLPVVGAVYPRTHDEVHTTVPQFVYRDNGFGIIKNAVISR